MTDAAPWHQALAYAVTGHRFPELGSQERPDLDELVAFLEPRVDRDRDAEGLARSHRLPPDLAAGLGPAQLWAAAAELRRRLAPGRGAPAAVTSRRPLSADERRLLQDVPPHHGG